MKKLIAWSVAGAAVLALSGCADNWDIDGVAGMKGTGDAFATALQANYLDSARFEKNEGNWSSVQYFTERARASAMGMAPAPQEPKERGLDGNADVTAARAKLMAALATKAPKDAPEACAKAQVSFEHWMEQLQEGWQTNDIATYKGNYDKAVALCVPKPEPVVAKPKMTMRYVVYFATGKATLDKAALKVLSDVAKEQAADKPINIYLAGHTDTVGNAATNQALSEKRSKAVAAELAKMGVATKALDLKALGETALAVQTKDNVAEGKNRRVEIWFEK